MSHILDFMLSEVMFYLKTVMFSMKKVLSQGVSSRFRLGYTDIFFQIRGVLTLWE